MPAVHACKCGHQWTDPEGGCSAPPLGKPLLCPACGETIIRVQDSPTVPVSAPKDTEETRLILSLQTDPGQPPSSSLAAQNVVGYQILHEVGRGGMGVVYQALQIKLNRTVALKMVLGGAHVSQEGLERFRLEAEAVARLQHPNIVQIYEVGEQNGLPYFSLEFVDGGSLAQKLQFENLTPSASARIVEDLARAMACAHQRGIVHRDLKPANVLLTKDGQPKITDFGLAKRLDVDCGFTRTGDVMGTPSYMSPEQAQGRIKEIGPASDIYSLGAIFYELLAGRPPYESDTITETLMMIVQEDPVPPSHLQPDVPEDLETICLKCLEKEPRKRYAAAEALAEDLHRFLSQEPILARPITALERGVKWARRRPALAALLGVCGLGVLIVLVGSLFYNVRLNQEKRLAQDERDRAEANFHKARAAVDLMLSRVGQEHLKHVPGMAQERQRLLEAALKFYEEIPQKENADATVRQETGRAYRRVGDISRLLGNQQRAEEAYRQSIAFFDRLQKENPQQADYRQELAASHFKTGEFLRASSNLVPAQEHVERARELLEALRADDPHNPDYRQALGRAWNEMGLIQLQRNQFPEAQAAYDWAVELQKSLAGNFPERHDYQEDLAGSHNDRGRLFRATGRPALAAQDYRAARDVFKKLEYQFPENTDYRKKLAAVLSNHGNVLYTLAFSQTSADARGSFLAQAEKDLDSAVAFQEKLAVSFPTVPEFQQELAKGTINLANVLVETNRLGDAEKTYHRAESILRKLVQEFAQVPEYASIRGGVLDNLAVNARKQGKGAKALSLLEEAASCHEAALKINPQNPDFRQRWRGHCKVLAETLLHVGKTGALLPAAEAPIRRYPDNAGEHYHAALLCARLSGLAKDASEIAPDERKTLAEACAERAVHLLKQALALGYQPAKPLAKDPAFVPLRAREDFKKLAGQ